MKPIAIPNRVLTIRIQWNEVKPSNILFLNIVVETKMIFIGFANDYMAGDLFPSTFSHEKSSPRFLPSPPPLAHSSTVVIDVSNVFSGKRFGIFLFALIVCRLFCYSIATAVVSSHHFHRIYKHRLCTSRIPYKKEKNGPYALFEV